MSAETSWLRQEPEDLTSSTPSWAREESTTTAVKLSALKVCVLGNKNLARLLITDIPETDEKHFVIGSLNYPKGEQVVPQTKYSAHDFDPKTNKVFCMSETEPKTKIFCKIDKETVLNAEVIIVLGPLEHLAPFIYNAFTSSEKQAMQKKTILYTGKVGEKFHAFPEARPLYLVGNDDMKTSALETAIKELRNDKGTKSHWDATTKNKSNLPHASRCCSFRFFRNTGFVFGGASATTTALLATKLITLTPSMILLAAGTAMVCFLLLFTAVLEYKRQRKVQQLESRRR